MAPAKRKQNKGPEDEQKKEKRRTQNRVAQRRHRLKRRLEQEMSRNVGQRRQPEPEIITSHPEEQYNDFSADEENLQFVPTSTPPLDLALQDDLGFHQTIDSFQGIFDTPNTHQMSLSRQQPIDSQAALPASEVRESVNIQDGFLSHHVPQDSFNNLYLGSHRSIETKIRTRQARIRLYAQQTRHCEYFMRSLQNLPTHTQSSTQFSGNLMLASNSPDTFL